MTDFERDAMFSLQLTFPEKSNVFSMTILTNFQCGSGRGVNSISVVN